MGEGEGGGGQDEDLLIPPPLHPLPPRGGEIFGRICLINYGLLSNSKLITQNSQLSISQLLSDHFENLVKHGSR